MKSRFNAVVTPRARTMRRRFRAARLLPAATSSLRHWCAGSSRAHPRRSARPQAPCWSTRSRIRFRRCRRRYARRRTAAPRPRSRPGRTSCSPPTSWRGKSATTAVPLLLYPAGCGDPCARSRTEYCRREWGRNHGTLLTSWTNSAPILTDEIFRP